MFTEPSLICEVKPTLNKMKVLDYTLIKLIPKPAYNSRPKQEVECVN